MLEDGADLCKSGCKKILPDASVNMYLVGNVCFHTVQGEEGGLN